MKKLFQVIFLDILFKNKSVVAVIIAYLLISFILLLTVDNKQKSDALTYHNEASKVVETNEFYPHESNLNDTYIWPSLYINTLAILYYSFGSSPIVGKVFNVFLTLLQLICLIITIPFFIDRKKDTIFFYCLFFLVYPNIYFMNMLTLTEPYFLALLFISIVYYLRIVKNNDTRYQNFISSGLFISLALLVRPVVILVPALMIGMYMYKKVPVKKMLIYLLIMITVISVYGMWQKSKVGRFTAWGTTSGVNLFREYNKYGTGRHNSKSLEYIFSFDTSQLNAFEKNEFYKRKALQWIKENPIEFIRITWKKSIFLFLYDGVQIETVFDELTPINSISFDAIKGKFTKGTVSYWVLFNQIVYGILLLSIIFGIYHLIRKNEYFNFLLLIAVPLLIFIVTLSASASSRYHYVIILSAFPLIFYGLEEIRSWKS